MSGDLPSKRITAALLALLAVRHRAPLVQLSVRGWPVGEVAGDAHGGGRTTRARAAKQGGLQYTQVQ